MKLKRQEKRILVTPKLILMKCLLSKTANTPKIEYPIAYMAIG